jgi:hypothetical protein
MKTTVLIAAMAVAVLGGVAAADLRPPGSAAEPGSAAAPGSAATPGSTPAQGSASSAAASVDAHDLCIDAIAKDPRLAKELGDAALGADTAAKQRAELDKEAGERRSQQDRETREQTTRQIALDQRQVILAYAALWVIAAGFVVFLWRKQGALKAEIASLRRELEDAAKDAKP